MLEYIYSINKYLGVLYDPKPYGDGKGGIVIDWLPFNCFAIPPRAQRINKFNFLGEADCCQFALYSAWLGRASDIDYAENYASKL